MMRPRPNPRIRTLPPTATVTATVCFMHNVITIVTRCKGVQLLFLFAILLGLVCRKYGRLEVQRVIINFGPSFAERLINVFGSH
jgi:hypothetical protein